MTYYCTFCFPKQTIANVTHISGGEVRHSAPLCSGMWLVEVHRLADKAVPNIISRMLSWNYGIVELQRKHQSS